MIPSRVAAYVGGVMPSIPTIPTAVLILGLFVVLAGLGTPAQAQTPDSTAVDPPRCARATAEAYLDVRNVRAKILNNGGLFWNGGANVYEVPKGGGVNAIFTAGLWLGGMVGDDLRVAASRYGPWEFWPGPIDGPRPSPELCAEYDRLWEVGLDDLQGGPAANANLSSWPVHAGAPFIDVDGDGAYQPDSGDRPQLLGDQQVWWIMNDAGGIHRNTGNEPMGVEVRTTAFAFNAPGAVGNATFYRYLIRNRSALPITQSYAGLFTDTDLGAAFDDYVGSDSTLGMGYYYNSDNLDDDHYGASPPAIGFTVLKRPHSSVNDSGECRYPDTKSVGFTNVLYSYGGGGVAGDPGRAQDFYNYMQSKWKDGQPVTAGGDGRNFSQDAARYFFDGDPVSGSFWSEVNVDNQGTARGSSDRSLVNGLGPFCMAPGEEVELVIAIVWSRGSSNLDSVRQLREDVAYIQSIRDVILTPRALPGGDTAREGPKLPFAASVFPNPAASGAATVRFSTPEALEASVTVFNALGQRVYVAAKPAVVAAGDHSWTLPTTAWPPGVYLVRITAGHAVATRRLVVTSGP